MYSKNSLKKAFSSADSVSSTSIFTLATLNSRAFSLRVLSHSRRSKIGRGFPVTYNVNNFVCFSYDTFTRTIHPSGSFSPVKVLNGSY